MLKLMVMYLQQIPLFGKLEDKSSISSENFKKNDIGESFFNEGIYTACDCDLKKQETPIWRLESKQIHHDPKTQTILFFSSTFIVSLVLKFHIIMLLKMTQHGI